MFGPDLKARRRITELEEQCEKLQRSFHALEIEWADTLDKVKRMMQRIAKRAEVVEKAEAAEADDGPSVEGSAPLLPPRMRAINAAILARRNRGGL